MKKYPALKIQQWGTGKDAPATEIYLTSMPLYDLKNADFDRWTPMNRDGYQRPPSPSRFGKGKGSITRYLLKELGSFPTSVLLNVRGELQFTPQKKIAEKIEFGELAIDENSKIIVIDGQHRIEALKQVVHEKPEFNEYPLPVSIMNFKDKFYEMVHFYIVNSRQKSIATDLVYKNLQTLMEKAVLGGREWIKEVILGPVEERKALSANIVDALNELPSSPFRGKILYAGETKTEGRIVKDFYLERFITKILKEKALSGIGVDELARLLAEYWSAIKELYPKCFENPDEYTLLKTPGIGSFTYLFPTIFAYTASEGRLNKEGFKHYLQMLQEKVEATELHLDFQNPIDEKWWSSAYGPSISKATKESDYDNIIKNFTKKIELVKKLRSEKDGRRPV